MLPHSPATFKADSRFPLDTSSQDYILSRSISDRHSEPALLTGFNPSVRVGHFPVSLAPVRSEAREIDGRETADPPSHEEDRLVLHASLRPSTSGVTWVRLSAAELRRAARYLAFEWSAAQKLRSAAPGHAKVRGPRSRAAAGADAAADHRRGDSHYRTNRSLPGRPDGQRSTKVRRGAPVRRVAGPLSSRTFPHRSRKHRLRHAGDRRFCLPRAFSSHRPVGSVVRQDLIRRPRILPQTS